MTAGRHEPETDTGKGGAVAPFPPPDPNGQVRRRGRPRHVPLPAERTLAALPPSYAGDSFKAAKSARRAFELFEYLAWKGDGATISEIADALGVPRSSTSVLVKTLRDMGYLQAYAGGVTATLKLGIVACHLGAIEVASHLTGLMTDMRARSGLTTVLTVESGGFVRSIDVLPSGESDYVLRPSSAKPLCHTAAGRTFLLDRDRAEIRRLLRHANAVGEPEEWLSEEALFADLAAARERGYVYQEGSATRWGAVAVGIRGGPGQPRMAILLGGAPAVIRARREELGVMLRDAVRALPRSRG